jgi:hypothetical protein
MTFFIFSLPIAYQTFHPMEQAVVVSSLKWLRTNDEKLYEAATWTGRKTMCGVWIARIIYVCFFPSLYPKQMLCDKENDN